MLSDPNPPLAGLRVLDASRVLAGPFCGQMLGDLGAEVIKLERPGSGDETRTWGPPFAPSPHPLPPGGEGGGRGLSAYFMSCNRNKRSVAVDLATPAGKEIFYQLIERSDVLLENFRAASAAKLGLAPAQLHARNPRLIVCSISGFGRTGPWSDLPGYDIAIQALSGLMSITGPPEGPPYKVGVAVTDILTGLNAAVAVLACLRARERSGHGYAIDLALLDCALAAQVNVLQAFLTSGQLPARQGNAHLQIVPYQQFGTLDGWIMIAVGNDGQFQRLCLAADRSDLANDDRFRTNADRVRHRDVLIPLLEQIFRQRSTAAWQDAMQTAQVPHAPVLDYAQILAEPHVAARGTKIQVRDPHGKLIDLLGSPIHIEGTQLREPLPPPALGADTVAVLRDILDMNNGQIAELQRQGIIGEPGASALGEFT